LGSKRNRTGEYVYIFFTGIVIVFMGGCISLKGLPIERENLDHAQKLFERGDYDGALKEYQKVIVSHRSVPPGDKALFYAGLIYAHQGYVRKDSSRSLDCFRKLARIYPQSAFAGQAKIWVGVLQENEKLNLEREDLNKSLKKSHHELERLSRDIDELKLTMKKSRLVDIEIDGKKKELLK